MICYWEAGLSYRKVINPVVKVFERKDMKVTRNNTDLIIKVLWTGGFDSIYRRSAEILEDCFVMKHYDLFVKENIEKHMRLFMGLGKWKSRIDRYLLNGALLRYKYNKTNLLAIQNYIECEAHRELILAGLKSKNMGG